MTKQLTSTEMLNRINAPINPQSINPLTRDQINLSISKILGSEGFDCLEDHEKELVGKLESYLGE